MIEYYKCINNDGSTSFTLNKIYKFIYPNDLEECENFIDDFKSPNGWAGCNYKHFEPSTYEEFIKQETGVYITNQFDYLIPFLEKLNKN